MSKKDSTNSKVPQIEDIRDTKNNASVVVSNYKTLDAVKDKAEIDKRAKDKQDAIHNPFYAIDLNTSKVKQNEGVSFIIDSKKPINKVSTDDELDDFLHNTYLQQMQLFNNRVDKYLNKSYTSFNELDKDIVSFNSMYDTLYYNGFNKRVKDYLDDKIKQEYINKYASAVASLQINEIQSKLDDVIELCNVDLDNTDINLMVNKEWLSNIQELIKDNYTTTSDNSLNGVLNSKSEQDKVKQFIDDFNKDDIEFYIFNLIKEYVYKEQLSLLDAYISKNKKYYTKVNKLYKEINKKIIDIVSNFSAYNQKLSEQNQYANATVPKQDNSKAINLYASKIFNNTYPLNKYTSIDKQNNIDYDIKINISYDNDFKDLRDIIFVDDINNNRLSLLPLDLAFFVGFTTLNNVNGGNIPITLTDVIKYISEDKKARIRKNQKANQLYDDKMQMFRSFKVKSIIKDKKSKKTLIEFKDAIPILENYKVQVASRNDEGYIIGASAILSILNFLSDIDNKDYITTFNTANNYINDNQQTTLTILNMKYYLIIKILQMNNAKDRGIKYNPHINLDDLFYQTALLKGKSNLNKTDRQRLRVQINTFLNHLKSNKLLADYDYTSNNLIASDSIKTASDTTNNKLSTNTSKSDLYIKL